MNFMWLDAMAAVQIILMFKNHKVNATGFEPTTTQFDNEHSTVQPNWPNDLAKLPKWSSVRLQTKWLWVLIPLQSLKTSDIAPVPNKEVLDIQATIDCRFTLKRVHEMIRIYS